MHEVIIPLNQETSDLANVQAEESFKIIHDEYARRYLDHLGIRSTAANKAALKSCSVLKDKDCSIVGVWAEHGNLERGVANAVAITAPSRQRLAAKGEEVDAFIRQWFTPREPINVEPLQVWQSGVGISDEDSNPSQVAVGCTASGARAAVQTTHGASKNASTDLQIEQDRARAAVKGTTLGLARGESVHRAAIHNSTKLDTDTKERYASEVTKLKAKFIFPFACEITPPCPGGVRLDPWKTSGTLDLDLPNKFLQEASTPVTVSLAEVQKLLANWVDEHMPIEMLTLRSEPEVFQRVRTALKAPKVARLVGMVTHLLYWLTLGSLRTDPSERLSEATVRGLQQAITGIWSDLETMHRSTSLGVSLALPCLLLTVKRCVERCFELQYKRFMSDESVRAALLIRLNTLCMRLFDPTCIYARFGKFDGSAKAIALMKQLEILSLGERKTKSTRLWSSSIHRDAATDVGKRSKDGGTTASPTILPRLPTSARGLVAPGQVVVGSLSAR
mmetsp:Transcript_44632/g.100544  ORF Transcript_44632/g.100544 Transcript_44632/m.100544 type:complete len:505 (+) Transcript_44632:113-1627(+)